MAETIGSGIFALLAVLVGWALPQIGRPHRQRVAIREELEILEKLPPGPAYERMRQRIDRNLSAYFGRRGEPAPEPPSYATPPPSRSEPVTPSPPPVTEPGDDDPGDHSAGTGWICQNCGAANGFAAAFCRECGAFHLTEAPDMSATPPARQYEPQPPQPILPPDAEPPPVFPHGAPKPPAQARSNLGEIGRYLAIGAAVVVLSVAGIVLLNLPSAVVIGPALVFGVAIGVWRESRDE
jgi:hypothetical protein